MKDITNEHSLLFWYKNTIGITINNPTLISSEENKRNTLNLKLGERISSEVSKTPPTLNIL